MLVLLLVLVVSGLGLGTTSSCIPNPIISNFKVHTPGQNALVPNPYYVLLGAEILISIEEFNLIQNEFHSCAVATITRGSQVVEVFRECNRSVFGNNPVIGTEGWSNLTLSLYRKDVELCSLSVAVFCCANESLSAEIANIRHQEVVDDFLAAGMLIPGPGHGPRNTHSDYSALVENPSVIKVRIAIKSGALNLRKRAAMRATWLGDLHSPSNEGGTVQFLVEPCFLVGNSSLAQSNVAIMDVLRKEQSVYGDMLLAEELPVEDTYTALGQKVMSFLASAYNQSHSADIDYVVIMDDDVFVDVLELKRYLTQLWRENVSRTLFYGGEVLEQRMHKTFHPLRDPQHRNYLPESAYPMDTLPPFALGNFYVLSGHLAGYIARNVDMLRLTGTLEDLSVGVWMMGLQVFPVHMSGVCDITRCLFDDDLFVAASQQGPAAADAHTDVVSPPRERILAVADLQRSEDFEVLNQLVQYRKTQPRGDSAKMLFLTKRVIRALSDHLVERKFNPSAAFGAVYIEDSV